MTRTLAALVAATLLASPALAADHAKLTAANTGTYTLDKSHANIVFGVNHLGFSSYLGRFNSFDATLMLDGADPTKSKVEVTITPASVDTNNSELEEKLRGENYFNIAQFADIKFVSTGLKVTGDNTGTMTGDLTLLGVTKPVTLGVTLNGAGKNPYAGADVVGFSAKGSLKRSDWGMKTLLPYVGDDVSLQIEVEFVKQAAPATTKE